jgi:hypothetical protein
MNPRIIDVKPENNYMLLLYFSNKEIRRFDMKPYLDTGIFRDLKNESLFNSVKPVLGSIQWANEADLCPDTLYLDSDPVAHSSSTSISAKRIHKPKEPATPFVHTL